MSPLAIDSVVIRKYFDTVYAYQSNKFCYYSVTEEGLFTLSHLLMQFFSPSSPKLLLSGDFDGLTVMEPYSEDPVIITSMRYHGFVIVSMIGT